jgi:ribonuclease BN (tRNA processing enzyme)
MSVVRLQFLGSGDAFGSGGRLQTCLRLFGAEDDLLIDCGTSTLIAMKRADLDPGEFGWVVVSHLHGDHFGGLPFLILDGQFRGRTRPLVVAGPPDTADRLSEAMEVLFPGSSRVQRRFETHVVELEPGVVCDVGPARVTAFLVEHASGAPAHALRIEYADKVVAYSGDTAWTDALLDVARDADLFVCEAYTFDKKVRYHLDYATLAANRNRLDCRHIVLTHMGEDLLARAAELDLEAATDGALVVV